MNHETSLRVFGPAASAAYLFRGLKMLGQPGLRHFVWGPLLINLLLYCLGGWLGVHYFSAVLDGLIPGWLEWLRWLLWPLFALVLSAIAFFSFTLVANIIASPFYGPLAAKVLSNSGIAVLREESGGFTAALLSGLAAEGRRMAYFAVRALPLLLLSFIPVINLIAPLLWLVFGAWSLSLEYRAYPLEALGLRFDEQRKLAGSHRLDALSFGGAIMVGLGIPLLNILIAPAAVVGATLYAVDRKLGSHR